MEQKSKVYFSSEISSSKVLELINKLNYKDFYDSEFIAIKIHFGEEGNLGYIKPEYLKNFIQDLKQKKVKTFLTDANTIYKGKRSDAVSHMDIALHHGFAQNKLGIPIIIADGLRGNSYEEVEVNCEKLKKVKVSNSIFYSDSIAFFNHFKGHEMSGFGGALKNIGMGCAPRAGKYEMHSDIKPKITINRCTGCFTCVKWCPSAALIKDGKKIAFITEKCVGCGECMLSCKYNVFQMQWDTGCLPLTKKMIEYAKGVLLNKKAIFVNFINHITLYCDCYGTKETPVCPDIGIAVSRDPVAIDKASYDLFLKITGKDLFKEKFPQTDPLLQIKYAKELGLGSDEYVLEEV